MSEIELNTTSHDDCIEDYDNPLEFYLSNVKQDSYFMDYIPSVFPLVSREEAIEIQKMVIDIIKQKASEK